MPLERVVTDAPGVASPVWPAAELDAFNRNAVGQAKRLQAQLLFDSGGSAVPGCLRDALSMVEHFQ